MHTLLYWTSFTKFLITKKFLLFFYLVKNNEHYLSSIIKTKNIKHSTYDIYLSLYSASEYASWILFFFFYSSCFSSSFFSRTHRCLFHSISLSPLFVSFFFLARCTFLSRLHDVSISLFILTIFLFLSFHFAHLLCMRSYSLLLLLLLLLFILIRGMPRTSIGFP
jgi:hypothetical protein